MNTENGHEALDQNGERRQATSTVLALDGWGPVVPQPVGNGANGALNGASEPSAEPSEEQPRAVSLGRRVRNRAQALPTLSTLSIDGQMARILASAAAMTFAVLAAASIGGILRARAERDDAPAPTPLSGWARLRRNLALAIDPSLTPAPPRRRAPMRGALPIRRIQDRALRAARQVTRTRG